MQKTFGASYFLLGADRAWPHKMFEAAEPLISRLGGRVVGKEFTTGKETDFAPLIDKVGATKAKILVFALKGDGLHFIGQADDRGLLKHTTVAFLGLSETDLSVFRGKGQNMYVVVPFVAASDEPSVMAFVAKARREAGPDTVVSNYVMTHYNVLVALKSALEKVRNVDKEGLVDALEGLVIQSPTGRVTIGKDHHVTMNMFLAKTQGTSLVQVRALGEIAPEPGCK
jgi:branched-chain amino acid transport system substrate-binding protein/urea transport system substrate-binding protein